MTVNTEFVRLEVDGGIGTIRLDRPPMNALSRRCADEIRSAAREAADRQDVRAVIVYGGEKVFAAGADVKEMAAMPASEMAAQAQELSSSFAAVAAIPKPTVAAITGGAGVGSGQGGN
jgi:enoyl-CoA hydratase